MHTSIYNKCFTTLSLLQSLVKSSQGLSFHDWGFRLILGILSGCVFSTKSN